MRGCRERTGAHTAHNMVNQAPRSIHSSMDLEGARAAGDAQERITLIVTQGTRHHSRFKGPLNAALGARHLAS